MAILPGMTAAQATVVVMSARNFWGRLTDPDYIPADFEYGPGGINDPAARARIAEYRAETARLHGQLEEELLGEHAGRDRVRRAGPGPEQHGPVGVLAGVG